MRNKVQFLRVHVSLMLIGEVAYHSWSTSVTVLGLCLSICVSDFDYVDHFLVSLVLSDLSPFSLTVISAYVRVFVFVHLLCLPSQ